MSPETCEYHIAMASDIATIKSDLLYIREKICTHVVEGERQGGFRDRLLMLEGEVSALKKAMWIRVTMAGTIGGLIGSHSVDAFTALVKFILGG